MCCFVSMHACSPNHKHTLCLQLLGENAAKISNFASYLRSVFRTDTDPTTLEVAAATLGHLVQTGGALTADVVEYEVHTPLHNTAVVTQLTVNTVVPHCLPGSANAEHSIAYVSVAAEHSCTELHTYQSMLSTAAQQCIHVSQCSALNHYNQPARNMLEPACPSCTLTSWAFQQQ